MNIQFKMRHIYCLLLICGLVACGADKPTDAETKNAEHQSTSVKEESSSPIEEKTTTPTKQQPITTPKEKTMPAIVNATLNTSMGSISLALNAEKAPVTVENFVKYAKSGHYDGTIFHRVIPAFMIQGGGFESGMQQKPTNAPIMNEADNGLSNSIYTVAMARTNEPHSATSQFFINVVDNSRLDYTSSNNWGYAVFGEVTEGKEVVDKIELVDTGRAGPHGDVPVEDVVIESVTIDNY